LAAVFNDDRVHFKIFRSVRPEIHPKTAQEVPWTSLSKLAT
jgi:hypothetical protein